MSDRPNLETQVEQFKAGFVRIRDEMAKMMVGQQAVVEGVLTAFFAGGHVLLEGVPGLGKTMLVRTLADAVDLKFARVQFTPDLMPADIVGTNMIAEDAHGRKSFQFQPGPVFANILLAENFRFTASASVRTSIVLPRPGTPSSRTWPPAKKATSTPSRISS